VRKPWVNWPRVGQHQHIPVGTSLSPYETVVFDNSKSKAFVPGFQATIPFREGIRRTLTWFEADAQRRRVDPDVHAEMDGILAAYTGQA
jgi:hypothetical protein